MPANLPMPALDAPASDWLVFADALQEARDPRGELIVLNQAAADGRAVAARDAFVAEHADALLGAAGPYVAHYRIAWRHCLVDAVDIRLAAGDPQREIVAALLASPAAAHVRSIRLVGVTDDRRTVSLSDAMAALAASRPPSCTSVAFVDDRAERSTLLVSRDFEPNANLVTFGSLDPFWSYEHVALVVADVEQIDLGTVDAPELESFRLACLCATDFEGQAPVVERLAAARWPKLREIELRLPETWLANIPTEEGAYVALYTEKEDRLDEAEDGETEGASWAQLGPLLANLSKCPLRRLALTSIQSSASLLDAIANAGLPPTLEELDLSDGHLGPEEADWMLAHRALFAPLRRLVLERTTLPEADAKRLQALGIEVRWSSSGGDRARYRYVVGSE